MCLLFDYLIFRGKCFDSYVYYRCRMGNCFGNGGYVFVLVVNEKRKLFLKMVDWLRMFI